MGTLMHLIEPIKPLLEWLFTTPQGIITTCGVILTFVVWLIKWTKTEKDDEVLYKVMEMAHKGAKYVDGVIADNTKIEILGYIDLAAKEVQRLYQEAYLNEMPKNALTLAKKELKRIGTLNPKVKN